MDLSEAALAVPWLWGLSKLKKGHYQELLQRRAARFAHQTVPLHNLFMQLMPLASCGAQGSDGSQAGRIQVTGCVTPVT